MDFVTQCLYSPTLPSHLCISLLDGIIAKLHAGVSNASRGEGIGTFSALKNVGQLTKEGVIGTATSPIYAVTTHTGTVRNFLWSLFRTGAVVFLLMSGAGALLEVKGVNKGFACHILSFDSFNIFCLFITV